MKGEFPLHSYQTALAFDAILTMLCEAAHCERARERLRALAPTTDETRCRHALEETTAARKVLDACGSPPLTSMEEAERVLALAFSGGMLSGPELESVARFAAASDRMGRYLASAESTGAAIALVGRGIDSLAALREEIENCIRGGEVDSCASNTLRDLRRKMDGVKAQIQSRLSASLSHRPHLFSDAMVVMRGGRYALPVKRMYRNEFQGTVVDVSASGGTVFMEPASVRKLSDDWAELHMEEENEIRRVLYALSGLVADSAPQIRRNMEALEALDFAFAKAQLSRQLNAIPPEITAKRSLRLVNARHPLLDPALCVPLSLELSEKVRGIVITGPNTGGKTVALKTLGLLALMAGCGLHVSAEAGTRICLFDAYLCDVGDGQSIAENLSTFSAHMTRVKDILEKAGPESLVLLDELGSGTDPQEGMGLAVAVLEELRLMGSMLVATTHYPEVKAYCQSAEGFTNARMCFDEETLAPTYRLEVGQAGRSCALAIARRIGLPDALLQRAQVCSMGQALAATPIEPATSPPAASPKPGASPRLTKPQASKIKAAKEPPQATHAQSFERGDCVMIYPSRELGIVCQTADGRGMLMVQVKTEKRQVNHKRLRRVAPAEEMYPENYDFSIVFDSVQNRKARHVLGKRHDPNAMVYMEQERDYGHD
jgi:dsDNA-specific endonuclease/ATPase MutS2